MNSESVHRYKTGGVVPSSNGCEECIKTGDTWVPLRLCLNCGHVGCCDQPKNKHATKHFIKSSTLLSIV